MVLTTENLKKDIWVSFYCSFFFFSFYCSFNFSISLRFSLKKLVGLKNRPSPQEKELTQKGTGLGRFKAFFLINSFLCSLPEARLSVSFIEAPAPPRPYSTDSFLPATSPLTHWRPIGLFFFFFLLFLPAFVHSEQPSVFFLFSPLERARALSLALTVITLLEIRQEHCHRGSSVYSQGWQVNNRPLLFRMRDQKRRE